MEDRRLAETLLGHLDALLSECDQIKPPFGPRRAVVDDARATLAEARVALRASGARQGQPEAGRAEGQEAAAAAAAAWACAEAVFEAYRKGGENGGSIDWSDLDEACERAKEALSARDGVDYSDLAVEGDDENE